MLNAHLKHGGPTTLHWVWQEGAALLVCLSVCLSVHPGALQIPRAALFSALVLLPVTPDKLVSMREKSAAITSQLPS